MFFLLICYLKKRATPYYLGNEDFTEKMAYFQKHQANYNTVFFGSSRIYRHLNSVLLDDILKENDLRSYNFAYAGIFNPEAYYLYENFIEQTEENQIKYALLEIQSLRLSAKNATTTKGSYWNTVPMLKYSIECKMDNQSIWALKNSISVYIKSFIYGLFDIKVLKNALNRKSLENPKGINGFYPLDQEIKGAEKNKYSKRWTDFHSDTTQVQPKIASAVNQAFYLKGHKKVNRGHYKKLKELLLTSKNKGIHLFFIIPPRLNKESYEELVPILNLLPQENTLSVYEYEKFKDLYLTENSFDSGHLNSEGANIFTNYVSQLIKEKINTPAE